MTALVLQYLWMIPAAPLLVSVAILGFWSQQRRLAAIAAIGGQVVALILSLSAFLATLGAPGFRSIHNFTWFVVGESPLRLGWVLDPLAAAMLLMISFVSLLIFVFSVGYMAEDRNFSRFFAYLSFFTAAMLGVVIANSLLLLFICWELVGLASYLLIGFWIEKPGAAAAAKKAFITTRIGDIGFFLGLLWLYHRSGTLLFYDGGHGCLEASALALTGAAAGSIALLIFCGAMGKSGQFPLHVWLPDAMEGPTPVSALIHAATMVAAGVFLVARVYLLFEQSAVNGVTQSLSVVVWVGVITALMAALIAVAQMDIKRILAYSTVSQLGLMMVSLGVGGWPAGIVHLIAHGFFKALLFLGSGSVIHGCHGEQDIRAMGGLRKTMPVTFATYAIGMMALSGVPLIFCGGWSKEGVLEEIGHWPASPWPWTLMLLGVVLTAFYMTRQVIYVFFGTAGSASARSHESPLIMLYPLLILAAATILLSAVMSAAWPWLNGYLANDPVKLNWNDLFSRSMVISFALVLIGMGAAWFIYARRRAPESDPIEDRNPGLFRFLNERMWLDDLYETTVQAGAHLLARLADWMDRNFWDGLVTLAAGVGRWLGITTRALDERGINVGVEGAAAGARGIGRLMAGAHSGRIQAYLAVVAIGALALLFFFAWLA